MTYLYFLSGLLASAALVFALLVLLVLALRNNWNHANRMRLSFIAPILLAVAIVYFCVTEFVPRAFDLVALAGKHYDVADLDLKEPQRGRSSLISEGQFYYFMPGTF